MRFGISMPIFGPLADTRLHAELAATAEEAGWDGYFVWDHIRWPWVDEIIDPWAAMTAIALRTERIRIGPMVTPIPRRRPQVVARQTVTLDRLSDGRLIFGAGSGGDHATEYANLGELTDPKVRATQLDEGLAVLAGLWSGQRFNFDGSHYQVKDTTFRPTPLQTPRIPVWIAGQWPYRKPLARAARWDGYVPIKADMSLTTPDETAQMAQALDLPSRRGFDLAVFSGPQDPALFFAAGATWCLDGPEPEALDVESIRRWIASGPRR